MGDINIKKVQVSYTGFCDQCYGIIPKGKIINGLHKDDKYILTVGVNTIHLCRGCLNKLYKILLEERFTNDNQG